MQNFFLPAQPRFIVLEYCKYIIVLFVIFLVFFLVKGTWCPLQKCRLPWAKVRRAVRNFREKHIGSTFIHAICSIIVLSYGDLAAISVRVVLGSVHIKHDCCYSVVSYPHVSHVLCDESFMVYFDRVFRDVVHSESILIGNGIVRYLIPSVVFIVFLLPLPLSLIYYPSIPALFHKLTGRSLPRFPKLDPVFDVFQGVYKDKMRWFAGVHLLYRLILWVVYLCLPDFISFAFVFFLLVHSLLQPFKNRKHNYFETVYLAYLSFMSIASSHISDAVTAFTLVRPGFTDPIDIMLSLLSFILLELPALIVIVRFCYKFLSKRVCCQRFVAKVKSCRKAEQVELEEEEEPPYYEAEWL